MSSTYTQQISLQSLSFCIVFNTMNFNNTGPLTLYCLKSEFMELWYTCEPQSKVVWSQRDLEEVIPLWGIVELVQEDEYDTWAEDIASEYEAWVKIKVTYPVVRDQDQKSTNADISVVVAEYHQAVPSSISPPIVPLESQVSSAGTLGTASNIHVNVQPDVEHITVELHDGIDEANPQNHCPCSPATSAIVVAATDVPLTINWILPLAEDTLVATSNIVNCTESHAALLIRHTAQLESVKDVLDVDLSDSDNKLCDTGIVDDVQETCDGTRSLPTNDSNVTLDAPVIPASGVHNLEGDVHMIFLNAVPDSEHDTLNYVNSQLRLMSGWQDHPDNDAYCWTRQEKIWNIIRYPDVPGNIAG
ncbi:hypothetical protein DACRYDRAFT_16631 [Dacryopinax primogenitus]|uniref:Uncharacterized protein n=1 Tax=Dacryopinax primogenitus (strain DJM 731) TaxID=1858805 RepID=M5FY00_DACPD|nr:uncharacterized protein DACRYDRAFT_16631 [Dacryopinax primogenitus]EJU00660.1 hypothetical protein DACRYDRAFT_16631 [Dacryopinax primogenitus]